eukprot:159042_1
MHYCDECEKRFVWEQEKKRRSCRQCGIPTRRHIQIVNVCECKGAVCSECVSKCPLVDDAFQRSQYEKEKDEKAKMETNTHQTKAKKPSQNKGFLFGFSLDNFICAQENDKRLKKILHKLTSDQTRSKTKHRISKIDSRRLENGKYRIDSNGVLKLMDAKGDSDDDGRIVIPDAYKDDVLQFFHNQLHDGRDRLIRNMEYEVYWYGMTA